MLILFLNHKLLPVRPFRDIPNLDPLSKSVTQHDKLKFLFQSFQRSLLHIPSSVTFSLSACLHYLYTQRHSSRHTTHCAAEYIKTSGLYDPSIGSPSKSGYSGNPIGVDGEH